MASNFRIDIDRNRENVRVRLNGDFDGTSAFELLNVLKERCDSADGVVIDTTGLKEIHPFGQATFRNNLYLLKPQRIRFAFTGTKAAQIAPERRVNVRDYPR